MLIQAVCGKIWILDTEVVGLELTTPYAELLTVEVRLALTETPFGETTQATDREGVRVYHRRARGLSGLLRGLHGTSPRLSIERPYGHYP